MPFDHFSAEELEKLYDGHRACVREMRAKSQWGLANYHAQLATTIAVELAERASKTQLFERQIPLFPREAPEPGAA